MSGTVKAGCQCTLYALICGLRPGVTMCIWGLDREDECSSQAGHMPTSPQSQPLTAVRRGGTGRAGCGEWAGWWWVILAHLQLMRGDNIKRAPYASSAGHIHGLGQAFWMALHTLGILHELPGLSDRRKTGNWSAPSLQSLLPNAVWVHLSEGSGDTNHLS